VAAAFAAVAGGSKLYGSGGFWDDAGWASFYRFPPVLRVALLLLATAFGVFLFPVGLALFAGLLFPLVLIVDVVAPGLPSRLIEGLWAAPAVLRAPYLAALAVPVFALSVLVVVSLLLGWLRNGRRLAEAFETPIDARPARKRLSDALWEVARGSAISADPPSESELGRRFVALLAEKHDQFTIHEAAYRYTPVATQFPDPEKVEEVAHRLAKASHPLIITRNFGRQREAVANLVSLAETLAIPVIEFQIAEFMNFPADHPLHQGFQYNDPTNPKRPRAVKARERVGAWVRELGVDDPELSPNHAWRHTFKAIGFRCSMSEKVIDAIVGHAPATIGRGYGEPTLIDKANELKKFSRF